MADTTLKKWNGTAWEEVYPETTVGQIQASGTPSSSTYLRGDGTWATVTAGTGDIEGVTAGAGLTGGGTSGTVTVSHADTSTQASVNNTGRTYIQDITLDTYGHITGITSATETVVDTNTTYSAGSGLTLSGTTFSHTDTSSQGSVNNSNGTVIQDVTLDTYGHVTSLGSVNLDTRYYTESEVNSLLSGKQAAGTYNTIIGTDSDINTSGSTIIDNIYVTDGVITSMGTRTLTTNDLGATRFYNDVYLNSSTSTASFISELTSEYGCFQNNNVVLKLAWSYAGNSNLDTGHSTIGTIELAGCVIETWGGTYKHIRITRPNTGTGGQGVYEYNDQGSGYSPGWREIWTSESDGSGSGLDADLLDGNHASAFYLASNPNGYTSNVGDITGVTAGGGISGGGTSGTVTVSHADTSAQGSVNNSSGTVIQDITLDTYGHITSIGSVNLDGRYYTESESNARYLGISAKAADANLLDGINSSQFLRSDATDTFTNLSGTSLTLGSGVTLKESSDRADLLRITSNTSGWGGIQIENSSLETLASFMTDGNAIGIYDDQQNEWAWLYYENSGHTFYHNGSAKLSTNSSGISLAGQIDMNNNDIVGVDQIIHEGDTNTYMQFHASDQWRVVTGGGERLEVNNTNTTVQNNLIVNGANAEVQGNIIWHEGNLTPNGLWTQIKSGTTTVASGTSTTNVTVSQSLGTTDVIAFELITASMGSATNQIFIIKLEDSNSVYSGILYNAYASSTLIRTGSVRIYRDPVVSTTVRFTYAYYHSNGSTSETADTVYVGKIWKLTGITGV